MILRSPWVCWVILLVAELGLAERLEAVEDQTRNKSPKERIEGRFFLMDKLCDLGLAECKERQDTLNYVQPVRVVPIGNPVPAVTINKNYVPSFSREKSSHQNSPGTHVGGSSTYGSAQRRPSHGSANSAYYSPGLGSPSLSGPQISQTFTQSFGSGTDLYQGSSQYSLGGSPSSQSRPVREGRIDECYCVLTPLCAANNVVGHRNQDYSTLIDPRVKNSNISAADNPDRASRSKRESLGPYEDSSQQQAQERQGLPFGPQGYRPPSCGGPGSGYVCCKAQAVDFNELNNPGSIRDVRQPNQVDSGFSKYGQCGRRNAHSTVQRINSPSQGGFKEGDAEFGEYPWQVAILKKEQYDNVYVCGGSLIDNSHVLTAAHCITKYRGEQLRVRLGEWDVNNDSEFYPNIELDVLSIRVHPEFTSGNLYNDIAVMKLDGFIDFLRNPHISPVCLPDDFQSFSGYRCYVSGWGKDTFGDGGNYQHLLKEVDVPVLESRECERMLRGTRLGPDFYLHPGFMCAGGEEGKDACKGDGGGPLVCSVRGVWQLAGIVSWGIGCGQRNVPGVYVKVNHYTDWIQESMLG